MAEFDSEEEKPQKPKKFAEMTLTIWDDAELDLDCVRFIKTGSGRGAPKKVVMLDKTEFLSEVENNILTADGLFKFLLQELKVKGLKIAPPTTSTPVQSKKEPEDDEEEDFEFNEDEES
jgi:hypothetical protein